MNKHDDGSLWQAREMSCAICSREWVAVFPIEASRLECPSCGYMNVNGSDGGRAPRELGEE